MSAIVVGCPSCGGRTWRIEYVEEVDTHRYVCATCGVPLILKRLRDLD